MSQTMLIQGRRLAGAELEEIRGLIAEHPQWSRRKISENLARQWDWRNGAGALKDMAARTMLLKLDQRGLIALPPRRRTPTNRMRVVRPPGSWDQTPVEGSLKDLEGLEIREVSGQAQERSRLAAALAQFHYLGYGGSVGENLQYAVVDAQERLLACALFGAAAWQCADRDAFIGWNTQQRKERLFLLANNCRFLILPWVRVPSLGSWILGRLVRRLSRDWQRKYGHPVALLESFVQRDRFAGTVYQAANWAKVGLTQGRTRQDRDRTLQAPLKDIYLYPLQKNFREVLGS
jgi:hypothetical protein